jgi:hypothetical protein
MGKPDFFVIGAGRSGTTAIYTYLKAHPQIFMPEVKETWHFCTDFIARRKGQLMEKYRADDAYFSLFADAKPGQRVGDATPAHFFSNIAAQNIQAYDPHAQFIVMLRSPIDTVYAIHNNLWINGDEDIASFEEALAAQADRQQGKRIPPSMRAMVEALYYYEIVTYTKHLQRFFALFPREQLHIIIFDDFVANTSKAYRGALEFLNVDSDFVTDFRPVNTNMHVYSPRLRVFMEQPPKWLMTVSNVFRPVLKPIYWRVRKLNEVRKPRPPMNPETRRRLQIEFTPEVERLSELLGRDLTHWVQPKQ